MSLPAPDLTPCDRIVGCLIGTAVGDSLGLPREGLSRRRARKMYSADLRHRFFFGRGMVSDDTEHAAMAAIAYASPDFERKLRSQLRSWFLSLPAGIGLATLKACIKLCLGLRNSGVYSAGNGPAMRAPIVGVLSKSPEEAVERAAISARVTHTHPWAIEGAVLVALAAHLRLPNAFFVHAEAVVKEERWIELSAKMKAARLQDRSLQEFADEIGCQHGVSGFILHTVPVVLYAWLQERSFEDTVRDVILLGGDADTTGAIAGGLMGARLGAEAIPGAWKKGVKDLRCSINYLGALAGDIASGQKPRENGWAMRLPRNVFFAVIVILHGFRRLLPPY